MRFRIYWRLFLTIAAFSFCLSYVVFRYSCLSLKVRSEISIKPPVVSADDCFARVDEDWLLDCITWDRKRQSSKLRNVILQDLRVNQSSAVGESPEQRRLFFHRIFTARDWPSKDPSYHGLQASGPGSVLRNAQNAIAVLHSVLNYARSYLRKSTVTLLDVPCGDMQWMPYVLDARSDIVYTGADIVPDLIAHHRRKFQRLKNSEFVEHDVVSVPLNRSYDVILVRDLLQHLWMADALTALKRLSDSGSKFLLVTTFPGAESNEDVDKGALGGRKSSYNLERSPFSLASPVCSSYDWDVEHISLWRLPLRQLSSS